MKTWLSLAALITLFFFSATANAADQCMLLTGQAVVKTDAGYEQARLGSNYFTSKDKFPEIIVYCKNAQEVQNAIQYAHCNKLPIRVRSGGHNHLGYSTSTGAMIIDVSHMKKMTIETTNKIATVEPGVTGGELYRGLFAKGLTQSGGTCSGVAISGLILSGGMGPMARKEGLACDSLLSVDVITADGKLLTATKDNAYKDLFWASCGGGGNNFGIVTSIKLKVYPAENVTWFNIGWGWDQPVEEVISQWQKSFYNNDKRWYSHLDLWAKKFPTEKLHQQPVKVMGLFWGTPDEAKAKLAPFLKIGHPATQIITQVNWLKSIEELEDAMKVYLTDKPQYKSSGAFVMKDMSKEGIHIMANDFIKAESPYLNIVFFSLGGAASEHATDATAYYYRRAKSFGVYSTQWLKADESAKYIDEINAMRVDLLPYTQGDYIGNQDDAIKDYMTAYYGENTQRLRCVKRKYDPDNVFHFEQSISPATAEMKC